MTFGRSEFLWARSKQPAYTWTRAVVPVQAALISALAVGGAIAQEERQLYRHADPIRPYKGYVLGPSTGATASENFETCEGQRIRVELAQLHKERGTCLGGRPGTMAWSVEELKGVAIFGSNQQQVGTIADVKLTAQGTVESVAVMAAEPFRTSDTPVTIYGDALDLQKLQGKPVQAIYLSTPDTLKTAPMWGN